MTAREHKVKHNRKIFRASVVGGLALAFKSGVLPPGACIVAVLVALFGVASLAAGVQSRRSAP